MGGVLHNYYTARRAVALVDPLTPIVVTTAQDTSNNADFDIDMPAGTVAGDRLLLIIGVNRSQADSTVDDESFTLLENNGIFNGGTDPPRQSGIAIFGKIAGASEPATLTIVGNGRKVAHLYRVGGAQDDPVAGTIGTGTSVPVTTPSLNPGWGNQETLWIAATHISRFTGDITAAPANYENFTVTGPGTAGRLATARRILTAESEQPGSWSYGGSGGLAVTANVNAVRAV